MIRIRQIHYEESEDVQNFIQQITEILKHQFPRIDQAEIDSIFDQFRNPLKIRFKTMIYIAENGRANIVGFIINLYEPNLNFFYLDYIATAIKFKGRGIGQALYKKLQEEARLLDVNGIFCDVYTDNPGDFKDKNILRQNRQRLKFYERFDAFPLINNFYSKPLTDHWYPSFLLYDGLERENTLSQDYIRIVVRAILERRYGDVCPVAYINSVVDSFSDEQIQLRHPLYTKKRSRRTSFEDFRKGLKQLDVKQKIQVIMNEFQKEHKVDNKGYFEVPTRIKAIEKEIKPFPFCHFRNSSEYPDSHILEVHIPEYIDFLQRVSKQITPNKTIFPEVFPLRNRTRMPKGLIERSGYYCLDSSTPLTHNIYNIAKRASECALTGADLLKRGYSICYALIRPPGHHAEPNIFGGYCYLNSTAIAAHYLSKEGKIAILDVDYHHGNGTQQIFYARSDVLTLSIHGNPDFEYPYFSGFQDEEGIEEGFGFNVNFPLEKEIEWNQYQEVLQKALERIKQHQPKYLVIAFGLDTARGDPTGTWLLLTEDYVKMGALISTLHLPTLIVQEGGYDIHVLGKNAAAFLQGFWEGFFSNKSENR